MLNASACCLSCEPRRCARSAVGDCLPPLAPPVVADEDVLLGVPAIRDLSRVLEVVPAFLAFLLALRLCLQDRVVRQVPQFDRELLVDLLGFRFGDLVVGHCGGLSLLGGLDATGASSRAPTQLPRTVGWTEAPPGRGDDGTRTHDPLLAKHASYVVITAHRHDNPYKHSDRLPVSSG